MGVSSDLSDAELLAELRALGPLPDETDPCWRDLNFWRRDPTRYMELADLAQLRKLRPAIRLLLDRACFGDPGEMMRVLRHRLEAIANPDWTFLADVCLEAAQSGRLGTQLWAIDQLAILNDPRARSTFMQAIDRGPDSICEAAKTGLRRLNSL